MKKIGISHLFCLVAVFSVLFSYYMTRETVKETLTVEDVYTVAQREGYSGTLAEFANTLRGAAGDDGRGIADAFINSNGHLVITYTDDESVDLGKIAAGSVNVFEDISGESIHAALTSSVSIIATMSDGKYSFGSGIIYKLDKSRGDAYILTNYHVVYDRYI